MSALIVCSFARRWQRHSVGIERGRADQVVIGNVERHNRAECLWGLGAGMVSDLDIWRAANLLIGRYGAGAELQAAQRADLMRDRGDDDGRLVWMCIRRAVEAIQAPPSSTPH